MPQRLPYTRRFRHEEQGAVTIDWVALTAGLLLLGIALIYGVYQSGAGPAAEALSTNLLAIDAQTDTGDAPTLNDGN
ncbi:MAG: hypothetical protein AAF908_01530 [Pseudomonadota bacterium]